MEEARGEKKVLYGRRLDRLDDSRLVKAIARKMEECGKVNWWGEYDHLLRKYRLEGNERGSAQEWKRGFMRETEGIGWKKWREKAV